MKNINLTQRIKEFKAAPHPFHLVDPSPWPLYTSFALLVMTIGAVLYFHGHSNGGALLTLGFFLTASGMILWFRDVIVEGTQLKHFYTDRSKQNIRMNNLIRKPTKLNSISHN
jgi:cytochrome c oxidase subunit 3